MELSRGWLLAGAGGGAQWDVKRACEACLRNQAAEMQAGQQQALASGPPSPPPPRSPASLKASAAAQRPSSSGSTVSSVESTVAVPMEEGDGISASAEKREQAERRKQKRKSRMLCDHSSSPTHCAAFWINAALFCCSFSGILRAEKMSRATAIIVQKTGPTSSSPRLCVAQEATALHRASCF